MFEVPPPEYKVVGKSEGGGNEVDDDDDDDDDGKMDDGGGDDAGILTHPKLEEKVEEMEEGGCGDGAENIGDDAAAADVLVVDPEDEPIEEESFVESPLSLPPAALFAIPSKHPSPGPCASSLRC